MTAPSSHTRSARLNPTAANPVAMGTRQSMGRLLKIVPLTIVKVPVAKTGPIVLLTLQSPHLS